MQLIPNTPGCFKMGVEVYLHVYIAWTMYAEEWETVEENRQISLPGSPFTSTMPAQVLGGDPVATQAFYAWMLSYVDTSAQVWSCEPDFGHAGYGEIVLVETLADGRHLFRQTTYSFYPYYSPEIPLARVLAGGVSAVAVVLLLLLLLLIVAAGGAVVCSAGASGAASARPQEEA